MTPLLLIGGGGHCRAVIDVIEAGRHFTIRGIVQPRADGDQPVLGYPIVGDDEALPALLAAGAAALITVGQIKTARIRQRLFQQLQALGAELPSIVSPLAHVSRHAPLGKGCVVLHGALVNAAARVGDNCIINSMALVEHDVILGAHCHVATGARINGGAQIGEGSFIGSGAILHQGVRIGPGCIIGAGAVIASDLPPETMVRRPL